VQAGLAHVRGDVAVLRDSDLQDAPEAIPRLLAEWQAGYDVVYAIRNRPQRASVKRLCLRGVSQDARLRSLRRACLPMPATLV